MLRERQPSGRGQAKRLHIPVPQGGLARFASAILGAVVSMSVVVPAYPQEIPIRPGVTPTRDLLTVAATAEVKAAPDTASVRLGVETQAKTAASATTTESNTMAAVVAAVRNAGVAVEDIRTSDLNLEPLYESRTANQAPTLQGFRASNIVQVTIHDLQKVGPVVDSGLGAGANRIDGISFLLADDLKVRSQALAKAAAEAAAKAQVLAGALGIKLGTLASVTEGGAVTPLPGGTRGFAAMAAEAAPTPVLPGQLTISATVTLQYQLR